MKPSSVLALVVYASISLTTLGCESQQVRCNNARVAAHDELVSLANALEQEAETLALPADVAQVFEREQRRFDIREVFNPYERLVNSKTNEYDDGSHLHWRFKSELLRLLNGRDPRWSLAAAYAPLREVTPPPTARVQWTAMLTYGQRALDCLHGMLALYPIEDEERAPDIRLPRQRPPEFRVGNSYIYSMAQMHEQLAAWRDGCFPLLRQARHSAASASSAIAASRDETTELAAARNASAELERQRLSLRADATAARRLANTATGSAIAFRDASAEFFRRLPSSTNARSRPESATQEAWEQCQAVAP